ncbi:MAG: hypothetical protein EPN21_01190 [Methylococcaceae bacterium]|nr:MAG: hypothetical protein EPN21_01190 [Methylococcaceae bacterium]
MIPVAGVFLHAIRATAAWNFDILCKIHGYVYYVPFVESEDTIFLKNIIPSRKYHKKYYKGPKHDS